MGVMNEDAIVTINNLTFNRGKRVIFDGINLTIPRGKITAILGPSGTGKTTLLKIIGGQLTPHDGTVTVDGTDIHQLSRKGLYEFRRKMSLLFQNSGLFTHSSVFENVAFPLREHTKLPYSIIHQIVLMKLH